MFKERTTKGIRKVVIERTVGFDLKAMQRVMNHLGLREAKEMLVEYLLNLAQYENAQHGIKAFGVGAIPTSVIIMGIKAMVIWPNANYAIGKNEEVFFFERGLSINDVMLLKIVDILSSTTPDISTTRSMLLELIYEPHSHEPI